MYDRCDTQHFLKEQQDTTWSAADVTNVSVNMKSKSCCLCSAVPDLINNRTTTRLQSLINGAEKKYVSDYWSIIRKQCSLITDQWEGKQTQVILFSLFILLQIWIIISHLCFLSFLSTTSFSFVSSFPRPSL